MSLLTQRQENDALDVFIIFEAVGALVTSAAFGFLLWLSSRRRNQALKGDEASALKIVLPCWRPLYQFMMGVYFLMALGLGLTFVTPLDVVTQFLVLQFTSLVMLVLYSIVPMLLTQKSVSNVAFRRTALVIAPWFCLCTLMWGLSDMRNATQPMQIVFWVVSCIPALALSLGILCKLISSRIQMGSSSNRASVEYVLVYACFFLGINISCVDDLAAGNTHRIWVLASLLATFSILWNQLFPLALHRTLLADTKFWRGLGRHNRGGLGHEGKTGLSVHKPTMDLGLVEDGLQKVMMDIEDLSIDFAYLQLTALIGEGSSAKVYQGQHKQQQVAIKVFTPPEVTEEIIDEFVTESKLLASLQHENIVSFFGICIRPPQIAMVMELCVMGNLKTSLTTYPEKWRREWRVRACYDAARAVEHLHSVGYIHRDLKAENFFIAENRVVKLGDFGEATKQLHHRAAPRASALASGNATALHQQQQQTRMSIVGTVAYMAPELVAASKKYSESIDVYSLAITFWEIWTGLDPYAEMNTFQIYEAVTAGRRPELPADTPASFAQLVGSAWGQSHQDRPVAAQVVKQLASILLLEYKYQVPPPVVFGLDRSSVGTPSSAGSKLSEFVSRKFLSPLRYSDDTSSAATSADGTVSPGSSRLTRLMAGARSPGNILSSKYLSSSARASNDLDARGSASSIGSSSRRSNDNSSSGTSREPSSIFTRDDSLTAAPAAPSDSSAATATSATSAAAAGGDYIPGPADLATVVNPMLASGAGVGAGAVGPRAESPAVVVVSNS